MKVNPRRRIGKDTRLHIQRSQVACVRVKHGEVAVLAGHIGIIKGTHGGTNILVDIRLTVRSVDIFVPAAVHQVSRWDHGCCKDSICTICGKIWKKISLSSTCYRPYLLL